MDFHTIKCKKGKEKVKEIGLGLPTHNMLKKKLRKNKIKWFNTNNNCLVLFLLYNFSSVPSLLTLRWEKSEKVKANITVKIMFYVKISGKNKCIFVSSQTRSSMVKQHKYSLHILTASIKTKTK